MTWPSASTNTRNYGPFLSARAVLFSFHALDSFIFWSMKCRLYYRNSGNLKLCWHFILHHELYGQGRSIEFMLINAKQGLAWHPRRGCTRDCGTPYYTYVFNVKHFCCWTNQFQVSDCLLYSAVFFLFWLTIWHVPQPLDRFFFH